MEEPEYSMVSNTIARKGLRVRIPLPAPRSYTCSPMRIEKSMSQIGDRLTRAREELRIAEEQLLFQMDVLEEAKTRMLVSETPLADEDYRIAREDFERLRRVRDEAAVRIEDLQKEQDRLLDRMLNG
jgi:hypothetical protein